MSHGRHDRALALHSALAKPQPGHRVHFKKQLAHLETVEGSNGTEEKAIECDLQLKLERSGVAQP